MTLTLTEIAPAAPEIFIFAMACIVLLVDVYLPERLRGITPALSLLTLVGAGALTLVGFGADTQITFNGMFIDDALADTLKLVTYILVFVVFVYSRGYIAERGMYRGEYYVLGLFGVVGMMIMASAGHLLTLYLGLELLALCLYTMVAFRRDSAAATEASMKYFVLGALASGMLLYGMSMLYGATGSLEIAVVREAALAQGTDDVILVLGLVFVVVGLAFKMGAVPFHMWVPDVYEGSPTSVTVYIGTAPKLAGFAIIMRLLVGGLEGMADAWQDMVMILAVLSMLFGNVIAIAQTNIKRMLAYSTIAHVGFFLLGILSASPGGYSASMFYIIVYAFMSLGAFGMVILMSRQGFEADRLEDFRGLNRKSRWYALLMLLLMFSMAGIPPTVGFFGKLAVIQAVIDAGMVWLAVLAVLLAVVGAYYYLRIVKLMYFDAPEDETPIVAGAGMRWLIGLNGLAMLLVIPWVGAIFDLFAAAIRGIS